MTLDALFYLTSPWAVAACALGSVVFAARRVACWWRGAHRYIADVAGAE